MPSRSCRQCIGLGILVSALVHGLGLALLLGRQPPLPAGGQETGLELDLALFAPVSGSEMPVARLPGSIPATRESAAVAQGPSEPGPEPVTTATSGLEAKTDILDEGTVLIGSELWSARSSERIPRGARVQVTARDGFVLDVIPVDETR